TREPTPRCSSAGSRFAPMRSRTRPTVYVFGFLRTACFQGLRNTALKPANRGARSRCSGLQLPRSEAAERSGARDDLAHVDILDGDARGSDGADQLARALGVLRGLPDGHRQALIVLPCPVAGDEALLRRDARHDLILEDLLGRVNVVDAHLDYDCMH